MSVRVDTLSTEQRAALYEMTFDIMCQGAMWALQPENQELMRQRSLSLTPADNVTVADIFRDLMGDFPHRTADIKPSCFNDFLMTLDETTTKETV